MESEPIRELGLLGDRRRVVTQVVDPGGQSNLDALLPSFRAPRRRACVVAGWIAYRLA